MKKFLPLSVLALLALVSCGTPAPSSEPAGSSSQPSSSASSSEQSNTSSGGQTPTSEDSHQSTTTSSQDSQPSSETSQSTSQSSEDPGPGERVEFDLDAAPKTFSHAPITEDDVTEIFTEMFGAPGSVLDGLKDIVDLVPIVNAMGFSKAEWLELAKLMDLLGTRGDDAESLEARLNKIVEKIRGIMVFFDGDKLLPVGYEDVKIRIPLPGSTMFGMSETALDALVKALPSGHSMISSLNAVKEVMNSSDVWSIEGSALRAVGKLVEVALRSFLEEEPDLLKFLIASPLYYTISWNTPTDRAYAESLQKKYSGPQLVSVIGRLCAKIHFRGGTLKKILKMYLDEGVYISARMSNTGIMDLTIYEAIEKMYADIADVVADADLEILYDLLADFASRLTSDIWDVEKTNPLHNPTAAIMEIYDELYGALSAGKKQGLNRLASAMGLDYDTMISGLRGLGNIDFTDRNGYSLLSEALKRIFQPVIDKYSGQVNTGLSTYSSEYGSSIYALQGDTVNAKMIQEITDGRLVRYDSMGTHAVKLDSIRLLDSVDTSTVGPKRFRVEANVVGEDTKVYLSIALMVLPRAFSDSFMLDAGASYRSYGIDSTPVLIDYVPEEVRNQITKTFGARANVFTYDATKHTLMRRLERVPYRYSDLDFTPGEHYTNLSVTVNGQSYKTVLHYAIVDASNTEERLSFSSDTARFDEEPKTVLAYAPKGLDRLTYSIEKYVRVGTMSYYRGGGMDKAVEFDEPLGHGTHSDILIGGKKYTIKVLNASDLENPSLAYNFYGNSIDDVALVRKGSDSASLLRVWLEGTYIVGDRIYSFYEDASKEALIQGLDTSAVTADTATARISYGGLGMDFNYVVYDSENAGAYHLQAYVYPNEPIKMAVATAGYEVVINGKKEFFGGNYYGETDVTELLAGQTIDTSIVGEYSKTLDITYIGQAATVELEYVVIDVEKLEFNFSRGIFVSSDDKGGFALEAPQYVEVTYDGERLLSTYTSYETFRDFTEGSHTAVATFDVLGKSVQKEIVYNVYRTMTYSLAEGSGPYLVPFGSTSAYISVYRSIMDGDRVVYSQWMQERVALDGTTVGMKELTHIKTESGVEIEGTISYFVYGANSVRTETTVNTPTVYPGDSYVQFEQVIATYVTLPDGTEVQIESMRRSRSVYLETPESRTPGDHEIAVRFDYGGQETMANYHVLGVNDPQMDLSSGRSSFSYQDQGNLIALGEEFDLASVRLSIDYTVDSTTYSDRSVSWSPYGGGASGSDSRRGGSIYVYGNDPELTFLVDFDKPTDGIVDGYAIYQGALVHFTYGVYDPANLENVQTKVETYSDNHFILEDFKNGGSAYLYGDIVTTATFAGETIEVRREHFSGNQTITAEEATAGKHQMAVELSDGSHVMVDFYLYSLFDTEHVNILDGGLNLYRQAYAVGDQADGYAWVRYSFVDDPERTNSTVLSFGALKIQGVDTSTSSKGKLRTASAEIGGKVFSTQYGVYDETDIQEEGYLEVYDALEGFADEAYANWGIRKFVDFDTLNYEVSREDVGSDFVAITATGGTFTVAKTFERDGTTYSVQGEGKIVPSNVDVSVYMKSGTLSPDTVIFNGDYEGVLPAGVERLVVQGYAYVYDGERSENYRFFSAATPKDVLAYYSQGEGFVVEYEGYRFTIDTWQYEYYAACIFQGYDLLSDDLPESFDAGVANIFLDTNYENGTISIVVDGQVYDPENPIELEAGEHRFSFTITNDSGTVFHFVISVVVAGQSN